MSRSNYQTRFLHKHGENGKGFVFSGIRFHGWEMAIGNLYLESGVGPEGGVNPGLLAALALFLQELRIPWIVVGDWNCTHDELASSGFLQSVHGKLLAPLEATTSQGSSIDFGVVCAKLAGCVSVETEWNVPFKPHAALLFTVHKAGASLPVPQPPKFVEAPGENQVEEEAKEVNEVLAMFELPSKKNKNRMSNGGVLWRSLRRISNCLEKAEAGAFQSSVNRWWNQQRQIKHGKEVELPSGKESSFGFNKGKKSPSNRPK